MLSAAVSTDSQQQAVRRGVAGLADRRAQQREHLQAALQAPPGVHVAPSEVALHALLEEAAERQEALHDLRERRLRLAEVPDEHAVEVPDDEPGVARELVAHGLGRGDEPARRVGERAGARVVDDERAQLVAGAARRIGPSSPVKPGCVAVTRVVAASSTRSAATPASLVAASNSLRRSRTTRRSRVTASARSA